MQSFDQALPVKDMDLVTGAGDRGKRIRVIVGASCGNLVEWYDFYIRLQTRTSRTKLSGASGCAYPVSHGLLFLRICGPSE